MSKSKTAKSFIFLFQSATVGFGDVLAVGFADVCFFFFYFFFFFLIVVGLIRVGVVGFVANVVVVVVVVVVVMVRVAVVVEVVINIGGGGFDKYGYGWICD